jgi:hypothetical protein
MEVNLKEHAMPTMGQSEIECNFGKSQQGVQTPGKSKIRNKIHIYRLQSALILNSISTHHS